MRIGTLKETYIADAALFDSRTQKAWLAVAATLLVLFPFMASDYWLYLACLVSINVASATGLNILTGYTGLVSLGQAAFMGLGAYTVAILQAKVGTPFLLNILAGGVVAMLGGIVVGVPSLRVKGLYLAVATIAASFIAHFLFANLHGQATLVIYLEKTGVSQAVLNQIVGEAQKSEHTFQQVLGLAATESGQIDPLAESLILEHLQIAFPNLPVQVRCALRRMFRP